MVSQQAVDVLEPGPTSAAPLKGPFVADCKQVFFIRVFTLGRDTSWHINYAGLQDSISGAEQSIDYVCYCWGFFFFVFLYGPFFDN